jgi:Skp family chaperone for outer membrane proteins
MIIKKYLPIIGFGILALSLLAYLLIDNRKEEDQIVYIDSTKVFDSFQMKKELDRVIEKDMLIDSQKLDSLGRVLDGLSKIPTTPLLTLNNLKQQYVDYKSKLDEKFQKLSADYTSQVNERLKLYIDEFGKSHQYKIILGGNLQEGVLYVDNALDITSEFIVYANKSYLDN